MCHVNVSFGKEAVTVEGLHAKQFSDKLSEFIAALSDKLSAPTNESSRWYYRPDKSYDWKAMILLDNARLEKEFKLNQFTKRDITLCQWPCATVDFNSMTLSPTTVLGSTHIEGLTQ